MSRCDDWLVSGPPAGDVLAARRRAKAHLTMAAPPPAVRREALLLLTAAILVLESRIAPAPQPDEVFAFVVDAVDGGPCRAQLSASAMQFVPVLAREVERLTIFQRSPQWAVPNPNYQLTVPDGKKWLLRHVPYYLGWYRFLLLWNVGDRMYPSFCADPSWQRPDISLNAANDSLRQPLTARQALGKMAPREGVDSVAAGKGVVYMTTLLSRLKQSGFTKLVATDIYRDITIRNYTTCQKILVSTVARTLILLRLRDSSANG